ncbi:MAG: hypothetical protein MUO85_04145 [candidate division Zixibacteria bacterium]|nr:hypothetical protein [candidate division Zixibacteria bacterium]
MLKYRKFISPLMLFLLLTLACGFARKKETSVEVNFKRIDRFFVEIYEVGVLKYEPYILPEGKILLYHFPVYLAGDKVRDFYVNLYGIPEDFVAFSKQRVSEEELKRMSLLWLLEEKTKNKPYQVLKRYEGTPAYQEIKKDVIEILSEK